VKTLVSLSVKALTVEFSDAGYKVRPLNGFSFDCDDGQLVVLLGPSGCGKTTLLSCLAGLLKPNSGSIWFNDSEVSGLRGQVLSAYRRQTVGVVFQAFGLIPSLNALSNVSVRLRRRGVPRSVARERAMALLAQVGLDGRAEHLPDQLSHGQQQRVAIARALVYDPPLLLVDEPTAHLDFIQVEETLRLLRTLASPGGRSWSPPTTTASANSPTRSLSSCHRCPPRSGSRGTSRSRQANTSSGRETPAIWST
jgi:putative ABC transport system ATP-binding protein